MKYLSLIDKLLLMFKILKNNFVLLIVVPVILLLLFASFILKNKQNIIIKVVFSLFLVSYLFIIISKFKILSKTFNNFISLFFKNLYFPSIYLFLFILFFTLIILIFTILSTNMDLKVKKINYFCSTIVLILTLLIVNTIGDTEIDLFSETSLFSNVNLVSLLELVVDVSIIWALVIFIHYFSQSLTLKIIDKPTKKVLKIVEEKFENRSHKLSFVDNNFIYNFNDLDFEKKDNKIVIEEKNEDINDNMITYNELINETINLNETKDEEKENISFLDSILNNTLKPIIVEKEKNDDVDNITKDDYKISDYKLFSKMLKQIIISSNKKTYKVEDLLNLNLSDKFSENDKMLFNKMLKSFVN